MLETKTSARRNPTEATEHNKLIKMMANYFEKEGYKYIRADLSGYTRPNSITDFNGNKYIPDLTCNKTDFKETRITLEAETCDTINDSHTARQWRAFYNASGEFHLVVPKTCGMQSGREKAQARLRELRISADEIWTPK